MIPGVQQRQQHGRQPTAGRGSGRLQHHVSGGLQQVGEGGLLFQRLGQRGLRVGLAHKALRLGAQNLRETVQAFGHQLGTVAPVQQVGRAHRPHQVQHGAQQKPAAVFGDLCQ